MSKLTKINSRSIKIKPLFRFQSKAILSKHLEIFKILLYINLIPFKNKNLPIICKFYFHKIYTPARYLERLKLCIIFPQKFFDSKFYYVLKCTKYICYLPLVFQNLHYVRMFFSFIDSYVLDERRIVKNFYFWTSKSDWSVAEWFEHWSRTHMVGSRGVVWFSRN